MGADAAIAPTTAPGYFILNHADNIPMDILIIMGLKIFLIR
jgi:hypothetical protein